MTVRPAVLRGHLLEEALAWLLRNAGYRLLVHDNQDPDELVMNGTSPVLEYDIDCAGGERLNGL
jgi:hypothetical protein